MHDPLEPHIFIQLMRRVIEGLPTSHHVRVRRSYMWKYFVDGKVFYRCDGHMISSNVAILYSFSF